MGLYGSTWVIPRSHRNTLCNSACTVFHDWVSMPEDPIPNPLPSPSPSPKRLAIHLWRFWCFGYPWWRFLLNRGLRGQVYLLVHYSLIRKKYSFIIFNSCLVSKDNKKPTKRNLKINLLPRGNNTCGRPVFEIRLFCFLYSSFLETLTFTKFIRLRSNIFL